MKIVTPYEITPSAILANTVTAPPEYDSGDSYVPEESVVRQTNYSWVVDDSKTVAGLFAGSVANKEFLFIGDNRTQHDPPMLPPFRFGRRGNLLSYVVNAAEWLEQGTANYMKAFDSAYGLNQEYPANTYTYDEDGDISWSIRLPGPVTSIAVLGARGTNVRIAKYGGAGYPGGGLTDLHNDTLDKLYPEYSNAYYNTLDEGVLREQDVILTGLTGLAAGDDIFIQVENTTSGQAAYVSNVVIGFEHDFGTTLADVRVSDASRSNVDFAPDSFTFVPRSPGTVLDIDIRLPGNSEDTTEYYRMQRLLKDHINRACLYIPDPNRPELTVFGMHKAPFEFIGMAGGYANYSLTVEST